MSRVRKAFTESFTDTLIATPLNMFLNWVILSIAFSYSWGPTYTTIVMTSILFTLAVARKTWIRLHFEKRYG